jgi:hypothetical protein
MFKRARESGAEAVEAGSSAAGARGGSSSAFTGTAFKLGSDATPSETVADPTAARRQREPQEFTLKMWQNGFSIDDGELRLYSDPANRAFLASVMAGRIPDDLIKAARGGEVHVNMEDHKTEEYVKPKVCNIYFVSFKKLHYNATFIHRFLPSPFKAPVTCWEAWLPPSPLAPPCPPCLQQLSPRPRTTMRITKRRQRRQ